MKSALVPRLVNNPFGDPGLFIALRWEGRAIQFDLGRIGRMSPGDVLKLSHVFVSHAHMDHFMGFDHLLRLFLARDQRLHMYGPADFLDRVKARLDGYTWNLTESYSFEIIGHEVTDDRVVTAHFRAATGFEREPAGERRFDGVLHEEDAFRVHGAVLDHKIPCLAFCVREKTHLNVDKDALERMGLRPGRWLNDLKAAIRAKEPDDRPITAQLKEEGRIVDETHTLGELRNELVRETRGQAIGYVVDALYNDGNREKITDLVGGADVFYCEAPFLDQDVDQATKRYHLTAKQAGLLGREAGVRRLEVFHFSPRYDGQADRIYAEARRAFRGTGDEAKSGGDGGGRARRAAAASRSQR